MKNRGTSQLVKMMTASLAVVLVALSTSAAYTSASYVQDGLVTQWDGIDNVGTGAHNPSATVWKDLKGNIDLTLNANGSWTNGNSLAFNGYAAYGNTAAPAYKTIEIVFLRRSGIVVFAGGMWSANRMVVVQNNKVFFDGSNINTKMFTVQATSNEIFCASAFYNGDTVSDVFCDGERRTDGTFKNSWLYKVSGDAGKVSIGERGANYTYPAYGNIYAIRLYSRRLTKAELAHNNMVDRERFMTSACYVQNGLIGQWDGENNAGTGVHDTTSTVWKDLKGNLDLELISGHGGWNAAGNALTVNGASAIGEDPMPACKTLELTYRNTKQTDLHNPILINASNSDRRQMVFFNDRGQKIYFSGINGTHIGVLTDGFNSNAVRSVAATYADPSAKATGTYLNGIANTGASRSDAWGVSVQKMLLGDNQTGEDYRPWIGEMYAIRLYDRMLSERELAGNAAMDQKRIFAPRQMTWKNLLDGNFVDTNNWTVSGTGGQKIPRYSDRVFLPSGDYAATLNEDWVIGELSIGAGAALKFTLPSDASATNVVRLTAFGKVEADASARIVLDAEAFCNAYKKGRVTLLSCDVASPTALQRLADNVSFVGAHVSRDRVEVSDDGKSLVYMIPPPGIVIFVE